MSTTDPLIRTISDTALWAAVYRARETDRPDALFRDPLARRLAGERGAQIAAAIPAKQQNDWAWVMRTYLFDRFITEQVRQGVDAVLNLAAGLDARPYRMALPPSLRWVEVDLPDLLAYKDNVLAGEKPVCQLERVRLDLADVAARRELFGRVGREARKVLVLSEGLLIYLSEEEVAALAADLAAPPSFRLWAVDIASPGLLRLLQKTIGTHTSQGSAPLKFGPKEGPGFFARSGWKPVEVHGLLKTAAPLGRLSFWMRLLALFPESKGEQGSRPWGGACLLAKEGPTEKGPG
jgi:methyltransferase (TIGR00027 family)